MKRQIAGILTGLLVCSAFLAGCGKNEATQAVKESVETEKEGNGESTEAEGKDQDKKSDAEETDGSTEESSGEDQAPEVVLDKIGILLPEERSDMNGSLERAELKSRLEENGYDAALYFAKEDADTQIGQIRALLQDENLKALVISPVDPYSLSDVLQEASDQSIPVIDYDDLIMDTDKIKYYVTFNTRAIGNEIGKNIVKQAELSLALVPALSGCGSDNTSSDNSTPDITSTTPQSTDSEPSSQQTTVSDIISLPESSDNSSTINDLRTQIVSTAEALVGVDYVSGMATPEQGFDNSGLIYYVLRENGFINCPRGTAAQKEMGTTVALSEIEPGDILFFTDKDSETGEMIDFAGIYTGNGQLIYSPYPGEKVKFADLNSSYWQNCFSRAVRVA